MDPFEIINTAMKFNEQINLGNIDGLAELMTDDHTFIDSEGTVTKGKAVMREGWKEFFRQYPDYKNIFTCVTVQNEIAVMVGYSTCSFKPLNGANIWTAKVIGNQVAEWRVIWLDKR
ncbi:MAG: nuclear transport factor 2 family protein [bacterium]